MNIKITYNWLLEYLETDAGPYDLAKFLSLSGPSFETVEKVDLGNGETDYVFDIEVTSNRVDMASVFGIAQEAQAILPQFGKKAILKVNPLDKYLFESSDTFSGSKKLNVEVKDPSLCSRFTAAVFRNVTIKQSPETVRKRLQMVNVKTINNVIDISNYLMLSLGQPTHMFDFDQIKNAKMIVRESKKGEKLTTLDGKEVKLPGGDIVIEDGSGRLIDLCGIMGGENSSITKDTKNVVLFIQTYDKKRIRKTSMLTGQRTIAATYFEKGLDPERVEPAFVYGTQLMNELTGGEVDSELTDLYPNPQKEKSVKVYLKDIQRVMGVPIEEEKIMDILKRLGFSVERHEDEELAYPDGVSFNVTVPTYRSDDVSIKEDIIEEVARVYGYYNLPNNISPMVYIKQPKDIERFFSVSSTVKHYLRDIGLHETMNYSMISEELIDNLELDKKEHLKLANTISKDIEYMRLSLIPSLLMNLQQNYGRREILKFFEIAKVYPKQEGSLPEERYKIAISVNTDFFDLKGILEALFDMLKIRNVAFKKSDNTLFSKTQQASIVDTTTSLEMGTMGQLHQKYQENMNMKEPVFAAELEFSFLTTYFQVAEPYKPPQPYAVIKLDATISSKDKYFQDMKDAAYEESNYLVNFEFIDAYKDNVTVRCYFSAPDHNLTEEEAKRDLERIVERIK